MHQLEGPVSECTLDFSLPLLLAFPLTVPGHEEEQDEQGQQGEGQAARAQAEGHAVHQLGGPQEQSRPSQALADSQPGQALGQFEAALPPRPCRQQSFVKAARNGQSQLPDQDHVHTHT